MTRSWRPVTAFLCFGASLLTLLGSFLDLFVGRYEFSRSNITVTVTGWDTTWAEGGRVMDESPIPFTHTGTPLIVAAVVLLGAAVVGLLAAAVPASSRLTRTSGALVVVGAAFLAGTVATIGMSELGWQDFFERVGASSEPSQTEQGPVTSGTIGVGFWLLVVAIALAVAAGVLTWRSSRPGSADGEREEPETPRFGIPVVVHRLPDEPPPEQP